MLKNEHRKSLQYLILQAFPVVREAGLEPARAYCTLEPEFGLPLIIYYYKSYLMLLNPFVSKGLVVILTLADFKALRL